MQEKGYVHIICGEGNGKTTSGVGLAVRCVGAGGKVLFFQFLKDGSSSELRTLEKLQGIELIAPIRVEKFVFSMTEDEKLAVKESYQKVWKELMKGYAMTAKGMVPLEAYDMLVLDEILPAIGYHFVEEEQVLEFLNARPQGLEVVLTGHEPTDALVDAADYVSRVSKIKHPFDKGVKARRMIEY